jgi:hypothetical protein
MSAKFASDYVTQRYHSQVTGSAKFDSLWQFFKQQGPNIVAHPLEILKRKEVDFARSTFIISSCIKRY